MMKIIPIPKPVLTEEEKIKETAHKLRQGHWSGFHDRKTDGYDVDKLHAYFLEVLDKWERKQLNSLPK